MKLEYYVKLSVLAVRDSVSSTTRDNDVLVLTSRKMYNLLFYRSFTSPHCNAYTKTNIPSGLDSWKSLRGWCPGAVRHIMGFFTNTNTNNYNHNLNKNINPIRINLISLIVFCQPFSFYCLNLQIKIEFLPLIL